jgi:hypothetical protein
MQLIILLCLIGLNSFGLSFKRNLATIKTSSNIVTKKSFSLKSFICYYEEISVPTLRGVSLVDVTLGK